VETWRSCMDPLIAALAPVLAAGLAIQQLFELFDPLLEPLGKTVKRCPCWAAYTKVAVTGA
jgi:hypothetical protein